MDGEFVSRLTRQAANNGFFYFLRLASRLLLIVALGKTLPPSEYGVYNLITTSLALLSYILHLDIHHYYVREVPGRTREANDKIFKSVVGVELLAVGAILVCALIVPGSVEAIATALGLHDHRYLVYLLVALLFFDIAATELSRYVTARAEIEYGNVIGFFQTAAWPLVLYGVYLLSAERIGLSLILTLWMGGVLVANAYGLWRVGLGSLLRAAFDPSIYMAAARFGIPIMGASVALLVIDWSDRYFIAAFHSTEAVGIYSYQYNLMSVIAPIAAVLIGNTLGPYLIEAYNRGDVGRSSMLLSTSLRYQALILIPSLLALGLWSSDLISLLAKPDYNVRNFLMLLLLPATLLVMLINIVGLVLVLERRTVEFGLSYGIAAILNLALNFVLVPLHPYYGAAVATDLAFGMLFLILWRRTRSSPLRIAVSLGSTTAAALVAAGGAWAVARLLPWSSVAGKLSVAVISMLAMYLAALWAFRVFSPQEKETLHHAVKHLAASVFPFGFSSRQ